MDSFFLHLHVSVLSPVVTETKPSTLANTGGSPTKAERAFRETYSFVVKLPLNPASLHLMDGIEDRESRTVSPDEHLDQPPNHLLHCSSVIDPLTLLL